MIDEGKYGTVITVELEDGTGRIDVSFDPHLQTDYHFVPKDDNESVLTHTTLYQLPPEMVEMLEQCVVMLINQKSERWLRRFQEKEFPQDQSGNSTEILDVAELTEFLGEETDG